MTPAEELRAAATHLREAAANATPGPWEVGNGEVIGLGIEQTGRGSFSYTAQLVQVLDDATRDEENYGGHDLGSTAADAAWIALASPALAEPLAALFDHYAAKYERLGETFGHPVTKPGERLAEGKPQLHVDFALTIARVILGGAQ
ncbi:hypothetical protein [Streptosporangium roseum]|uniref:hypothetical protein n=1 Tax=Streptosporangium roseum TaxID=2001 RepID=UPI0004CD1329|nr:hypothetical protein [Streptosporangium roseum]